MNRQLFNTKALLFLLCFLYIMRCFSQPGNLDTSFGINGVSQCFDNGTSFSVAIQNDHRIVAGGGGTGPLFSIARFNTDGSLDLGFGDNGLSEISLGLGSNFAFGMAVQPDGKILQSGNCIDNTLKTSFALMRWTSDGTLDNSFGENGIVITTFNQSGFDDIGTEIALQQDGKIVQVGGGTSDEGIKNYAVARFNSDGSLDNTFNSDGLVLTNVSSNDPAKCVTLQSDGKILVAGSTNFTAPSSFVLLRYNSNGSLDNSFGANGKVTTFFGAGGSSGEEYDRDRANAIALQSDGKILLTGDSYLGFNTWNGIPIARYNTDGSLDNTFGIEGQVYLVNDSFGYSAETILIQSDSKILIAGSVNYDSGGSLNDFLLLRLNSNGTIDSTFGMNGFSITSTSDFADKLFSASLQFNGQIVVSGQSNQIFTVARYLNDLNIGIDTPMVKTTNLFPNPTSSIIRFQLKFSPETKITLLNLLGEKVRVEKVSGGDVTIDVSELPTGLYIVRAEEKLIGKFVKE